MTDRTRIDPAGKEFRDVLAAEGGERGWKYLGAWLTLHQAYNRGWLQPEDADLFDLFLEDMADGGGPTWSELRGW